MSEDLQPTIEKSQEEPLFKLLAKTFKTVISDLNSSNNESVDLDGLQKSLTAYFKAPEKETLIENSGYSSEALVAMILQFVITQNNESGGIIKEDGSLDMSLLEARLGDAEKLLSQPDLDEDQSKLEQFLQITISEQSSRIAEIAEDYATEAQTIAGDTRSKINLSSVGLLALTTGASTWFTIKFAEEFLRGLYLDSTAGEAVHTTLGKKVINDFAVYDVAPYAAGIAAFVASVVVGRLIQNYSQHRGVKKYLTITGALALGAVILSFDGSATISQASRNQYLEDSRLGTKDAVDTVIDPTTSALNTVVADQFSPNSALNKIAVDDINDLSEGLSGRESEQRGGVGPIADSFKSISSGSLSALAKNSSGVRAAFSQLERSIAVIPGGESFSPTDIISLLEKRGSEKGLDEIYALYLTAVENNINTYFLPIIQEKISIIDEAETAPLLQDAQRELITVFEDMQAFISGHAEALNSITVAYNQYAEALQKAGNSLYTSDLPIEQVTLPSLELDLSDVIDALENSFPKIESQTVPEYVALMSSTTAGLTTLILWGILRPIIIDFLPLATLTKRAVAANRRNKPREEALTEEFIAAMENFKIMVNDFLKAAFPESKIVPYTLKDILIVVEDLLAKDNERITSFDSTKPNGKRNGKVKGAYKWVKNYFSADPTRPPYQRLLDVATAFGEMGDDENLQIEFTEALFAKLATPYKKGMKPRKVLAERQVQQDQFSAGTDNKNHLSALAIAVEDKRDSAVKKAKLLTDVNKKLILDSKNEDLTSALLHFENCLNQSKGLVEADIDVISNATSDLTAAQAELEALEANANKILESIQAPLKAANFRVSSAVTRVKNSLEREKDLILTENLDPQLAKDYTSFISFFETLSVLSDLNDSLRLNPYLALDKKEVIDAKIAELAEFEPALGQYQDIDNAIVQHLAS